MIVWFADSFFLKYSLYLKDVITPGMRWTIGILNVAGGFLLARNGLREVFGDIRENPIVIDTGPFKYSRHPIYFGVILIYFGFVIATGSLISLILFMLIIAFYYYISLHEEKLLIGKFGKDYEKYTGSTPMLIPRVSKKNRKLYIGFLLLFHAIIFTLALNVEILELIGYILYLVSAVYLLQGYKVYKENKK
jgi:protein-S-isoprenylcysteine O-methyltransferase Ste14